jgi:hypothetical protein
MIGLNIKKELDKNSRFASIITACLFLAVVLAIVGTASAATLTVDDDGGANYTTISDSIANANDGDVILVENGTYKEKIEINVNNLTLKAAEDAVPVIKNDKIAAGGESMVTVTADNVTVEGMIIKTQPADGAAPNALILNGDYNKAINNTVKHNNVPFGHPLIGGGGESPLIKGNVLHDGVIGYWGSGDVQIIDNEINGNASEIGGEGIWLAGENFGDVIIKNNNFENFDSNLPDAKKDVKIVHKPVSVNNETEPKKMAKAIFAENPTIDRTIGSIYLQWTGSSGTTYYLEDENIQDAINGAVEGDTVFVEPGTYDEDVNVDVKNLTLESWETHKAVIEGNVSIKASGVILDGFKVTPSAVFTEIPAAAVYVGGDLYNVSVNNNIISDVYGDGSVTIHGIQIYEEKYPGAKNITISNNIIKNINNSGGAECSGSVGVKVQGAVEDTNVINNMIKDIRSNGWAYGITSTYTNSGDKPAPRGVIIKDNKICSVNDGSVYDVEADPESAPYHGSAVHVTNNSETVIAQYNYFFNTPVGVNNLPDEELDATYNYWNSSEGPEGTNAAKAIGNITYEPYLENGVGITIEEYINGKDADTPEGPHIQVGTEVTWTYNITNTGSFKLYDITVTDSLHSEIDCPKDTLKPGETVEITKTGTCEMGQHSGIATVTGDTLCDITVKDTDPCNYFGYDHWSGVPTANPVLLTGVLGIAVLLFLRREQKK